LAKTIVVIPAMNEEQHIKDVVAKARKYVKTVLVVDDGSVDETAKVAKRAGAEVISLPKNMGKGFALRIGAIEAMNKGADIIVFMDGDGQHRPEDIKPFADSVKRGHDLVFGRRKAGRMPVVKRVGNWGIRLIFRLLFGKYPGDLLCGFKAMKAEILPNIMWKKQDYSVEIEIAVRAAHQKFNVGYVDIPTIYHDPGKGTTVMDGLKMGLEMLRLKWMILRERM